MFSIKANFKLDDVEDYIAKESEAYINNRLEQLRSLGKEFTERARSKVNKTEKVFNNITWNMVSSMGYCLVYQNKVIESYFPPAKSDTTGQDTGAKFAKDAAFELPESKNDIVLVLAAGEFYATFLKVKGYDVISSASTAFGLEIERLWQ